MTTSDPDRPSLGGDSLNRESVVLFRTGGIEITIVPIGSYAVARIRGRVQDGQQALLDAISSSTGNIALDLSGATGIDLALVQALCEWADSHRARGYQVALVAPPPRFLTLLDLLGERALMPAVNADADLEPAEGAPAAAKNVRLSRVSELIRKQLAKNVLWRYTDTERNWLCPFCGTFPLGIRLGSPSSPDEGMIARMSLHLRLRCPGFNRPDPSYLTAEALEKEVIRQDAAKDETSVIRTDHLRRELAQMETTARRVESMEKDIRGAAERQQILLPPPPRDFNGCDISVFYRPCDSISGDFYDFVRTKGGSYAFVIGDVSGHGVHAGILMGIAKKVLQIRLAEMPNVAEAIAKANSDLHEDLKLRSFVTAFIAVYNPKDFSWTMYRAGHNPAMWCSPKGVAGVRSINPAGLMLGVAVGERFSGGLVPARFISQPGDVVLIYSDGVVEAMDAKNEQYGEERLESVFGRRALRGPEAVVRKLEKDLETFIGDTELQDDATAVCIRVTGTPV